MLTAREGWAVARPGSIRQMKELLQGRRLGFALRPAFGQVAFGLGLAAVLVDLAAWFAWGTRETNAFVWAAYWLFGGVAILGLLAVLCSLAELRDVPGDERSLARIDLAVLALAAVAATISMALRSGELGAAGASPAPLLIGILSLVAVGAALVTGGDLYAAREWELIDEVHAREPHSRKGAHAR